MPKRQYYCTISLLLSLLAGSNLAGALALPQRDVDNDDNGDEPSAPGRPSSALPSASSSSSSGASSSGSITPVGLAVGFGIGVATCAIVGLLVWLSFRIRRNNPNSSVNNNNNNHGGGGIREEKAVGAPGRGKRGGGNGSRNSSLPPPRSHLDSLFESPDAKEQSVAGSRPGTSRDNLSIPGSRPGTARRDKRFSSASSFATKGGNSRRVSWWLIAPA